MKKTITFKLSSIALGLFLFSPQLKADVPEKVDYTDYLVNPSFEYYVENGAVDLTDPIDVTATDSRLYSGALRGTPPGWEDSENYGTIVSPATKVSYGINRGAVNKDGYNHVWFSASPIPTSFTLYQNVTGLPAGQYLVSCKMMISSARLSNQRLFASTGESNIVSQYFGVEANYRITTTEPATTNIVSGESYTFAGWEMSTSTADSEARLKPMSVVITVAEGETLTIGIKTSTLKNDGTSPTSNIGFFKADDFRLTRLPVPEDPNDYTSKITNPSFEQILVEGVPTQLLTHNIAAYSETDPQRGVPYGWHDIIDDSGNPTPAAIGTSYGVNSDANEIDGAKHMWVLRSPFVTSYTLYQDIAGLPSGRYSVSCSMYIQDGRITTQRLFANNNVVYYGAAADYNKNLTAGEVNSFAGLTTSTNGPSDGLFLKKMSVEVDVHTDESLRIGVKSSNIMKDSTIATGSEGWFKLDNFRLQRIGDLTPTGNAKVTDSYFTVSGQKDGFFLNMEKETLATVKVQSLSGQLVYEKRVNATKSWISLPQGLYIVQVSANGINKATKVLVK